MTSRVLPSELIEQVFSRLVALYGASFTRMWKDVNAQTMKFTWARELGGLAEQEIIRGLEACRMRAYPPTLPEFRNLCRPPIEPEAAYYEAAGRWPARDGWSHPAIYWAALAVGDDVRKMPWNVIKARWCAALNRAQHEALPLPLPHPPPRLQAPCVDPAELEAARARAMAKVRRP